MKAVFSFLLMMPLLIPSNCLNDETTSTVSKQYTELPYPPRNPADEFSRLISDVPSHPGFVDHFIFGERTFTAPATSRSPTNPLRVLIAGGGTGDVTTYLNEIYQSLDGNYAATSAEIYHLDLSSASIDVARSRIHIRDSIRQTGRKAGHPKITFLQGSLLDLSTPSGRISLGLPSDILFDFINSSGVLHHLSSPVEGLRALSSVLRPGGGMFIMVYGHHGRTGIYDIQSALKLVPASSTSTSTCLETVRHILSNLPGTHRLQTTKATLSDSGMWETDEEIYDVFCHSQDRAYTVPEIFEWIEGAGKGELVMSSWGVPALYNLSTYYPDGIGIKSDYMGGDMLDGFQLAELLGGGHAKHQFYVKKLLPQERVDGNYQGRTIYSGFHSASLSLSSSPPPPATKSVTAPAISKMVFCAAASHELQNFTPDQWPVEFSSSWKHNSELRCDFSFGSNAGGGIVDLKVNVPCLALAFLARLDCVRNVGEVIDIVWREEEPTWGGKDRRLVEEKIKDLVEHLYEIGQVVPLPPLSLQRSASANQSTKKISSSPIVHHFPTFLSHSETEYLRQTAPSMSPSPHNELIYTGNLQESFAKHRTSIASGYFVQQEDISEVLRGIVRKYADFASLPASHAEVLQVQRYGKEGRYTCHYDPAWNAEEKRPFSTEELRRMGGDYPGGKRVKTIISYLVNTCMGGETVFPIIPGTTNELVSIDDACRDRGPDANGIMIRPREGSGVMFQHWKGSDYSHFDPLSWHCSCPVGTDTGRDDSSVYGRRIDEEFCVEEKWVTQYWVRERPWSLWRDESVIASYNFYQTPASSDDGDDRRVNGYAYHGGSVPSLTSDFPLTWGMTIASLTTDDGGVVGLTPFVKGGAVRGELNGVRAGAAGVTIAVAFLINEGQGGPNPTVRVEVGGVKFNILSPEIIARLYPQEVDGKGEARRIEELNQFGAVVVTVGGGAEVEVVYKFNSESVKLCSGKVDCMHYRVEVVAAEDGSGPEELVVHNVGAENFVLGGLRVFRRALTNEEVDFGTFFGWT